MWLFVLRIDNKIINAMKKITFVLVTTLLIFPSLLQAGQAEDAKSESIEIFSFFNLRFGSVDTAYMHSYILDFSAGHPESFASQTLTLQDRTSCGFNAGVSFPLHRSLRFKLSVNYSRSLLKGENSPYQIHLEYISMPPPNYTPIKIISDHSLEWTETQGSLKTLSFLLNLEYAHALSKNMTVSFSAGGGLYWIFGDFNPLGYTEYWLGGHSVLMSEYYLLMLKIPSSNKIGINVDMGLAHRLSKKLFIAANIAYHLCGDLSIEPSLDYALYRCSLDRIDESKLNQIQNDLDFGPLEINPSFFSLNIGFKYRF